MKKIGVINTININGIEYDADKLPEESRKEIGQRLSDNFMAAMGYEPVRPRQRKEIRLPEEAIYIEKAPGSCNFTGAASQIDSTQNTA